MSKDSTTKPKPPQIPNDKDLTASDIQKAAGLSYRQLNDWDEKGVLPQNREKEEGWRKFTPNEAFILLVCKELRDRFGISLEVLARLQKDLLGDNFNYLEHTINRMGYGLTVCLLTNLKETFDVENDLEIATYFKHGIMRNNGAEDYIILRLNPLVNKILETLKLPLIQSNNALYDGLLDTMNKSAAHDAAELHLLELARSKEFRSITVHLKDGQIIQTDTFEELGKKVNGEKALLKILKEKKYQSISIDLTGGEVIRVTRKSPKKYHNKETGKP